MTETPIFYADYASFKQYEATCLKPKHVHQYDAEFWSTTECTPGMAVLELGCGTGQFLMYLAGKGIDDFLGVDFDPGVDAVMPEAIRPHFRATDVWTFLDDGAEGRSFDRIVLFDVIEHFTPIDGVRLLKALATILRPDGRVLIRVPNNASPWAGRYQYGDLTHLAHYTSSSMRQLALAAGFECTDCLPQRKRGLRRMLGMFEDGLHGLLNWVLTDPPDLWSANMLAVLRVRYTPCEEQLSVE